MFVALEAICAQLDQDQLAFVYKSPSAVRPDAGGSNPPGVPPSCRRRFDPMTGRAELASWVPRRPAAGGLPPHERAALDEIRRSLKEGAEVVVVVRPRGNADAHSEVIMLDHVSPEFLKQLAAEQQSPAAPLTAKRRSSDEPFPTSLELPNSSPELPKPAVDLPEPRKKWLEWSAPDGARPRG